MLWLCAILVLGIRYSNKMLGDKEGYLFDYIVNISVVRSHDSVCLYITFSDPCADSFDFASGTSCRLCTEYSWIRMQDRVDLDSVLAYQPINIAIEDRMGW